MESENSLKIRETARRNGATFFTRIQPSFTLKNFTGTIKSSAVTKYIIRMGKFWRSSGCIFIIILLFIVCQCQGEEFCHISRDMLIS